MANTYSPYPHYSWVACKPGWPGAYASHTDDEEFADSLLEFKRREEARGCTVNRVTCDEAHKLLREYMDWFDAQEQPTT